MESHFKVSEKGEIKTQETLGRIGILASTACAIHCAITPFIAGLLPFIGLNFLADERIEWLFILFSIGIGSYSLLTSYFRLHRQLSPIMVFIFGVSFLISAPVFFEKNLKVEISSAIIGACLIASAHLINRKLTRAITPCVSHVP
jgi:hypothetical protein